MLAIPRAPRGAHTRQRVASRRRRGLFGCIIAAVVVAVSLWVGEAPVQAATPVDEVHYTFTGQTSVAIDWRGTANDVRWGLDNSYGNTAQGVPPQWTPWSSAGPFWQLQLAGLAAGTTYHYSIGGGPDWTFHTPPTGSFRFDAIGDVGDTTSFGHLGDTLSAIANDDPSFVLMVGDLTYANAAGSSQSVVDQHFNDVMNSWGESAAYMPAWGNHEYDVPGADDLNNYKGRLLMPNAQASPGSPAISCCGDDWGWFDAGPVRFISYPEPWPGAWADWQSKASTIMAQAQNDPNIKYIVTFGHRPAYSTGYHPGETSLAAILDGFGDTYSKYVLNINGHSHDYERFQPIHGVTHITAGAPSSLEEPWSSTDPRTALRAYHLSHLRVDVSDTGLRIQAICDDATSKDDTTCASGSVLDEYTIGTPPSSPPTTAYYVDNTMSNCSDLGPGTATQPFCTLAKGVGRMQPGFTLYVGNGTYAETIKPSVSGTATSPITITAWPGRSPTIGTGSVTNGAYISAKSYIVLSNLTFANTTGDGIYVTKSSHITISGDNVSGSGRPLQGQTAPGISLRATNSSTVSGNTSDHNNGHGIYITNTSTADTITDNEASFNAEGWERNANGVDVTAPGNTILRNVTHDNEDTGINIYTGADNSLVANNVTYNNGDHGIDDLNVSGGRILDNTVFHNCTSGINVEGTSSNYVVENNIAVDNAVYPAYHGIACSRRAGNIGIWDSAPATTTVDHNLVYLSKSGVMYAFKSTYTSLAAMQAATGQETHGVQADPKWEDPANADFQLTEGSPAIDRGDSSLPDQQSTDILGNRRVDDVNVPNTNATGPRLYDDLGAFEFQPDVAPAPTPPTPRLSVTPSTGTAPLQVTADASASTDPRGEQLRYSFDFGDGTVTGSQTSPTAVHTYTTAGTYSAKVTVTDTDGLVDSTQQNVTVSPAPTAPGAKLSVTPTSGRAPAQVTADASASTDRQGQTLSYAFDFGDGTTIAAQPLPTAFHTYTTPGTYLVTTAVTDTDGRTGTATQTVIVQPPPSAPTARLSLSPSTGTAPVQVTADASGSTDPQGETLAYGFDFGDGTTIASQPDATASHTYAAAGTYTVTTTVTDTDGLVGTDTQTVTVAAPLTAPTAQVSVTPTTGTAPVQVTADATGSTDPQGQSLTYAYDFGDGTSRGAQSDPTATHTYSAAGTYVLQVTVTDSSGLSDSASQTVTVNPPPSPPVPQLTVTPSSGTAPVQVTADASGSVDPQGGALAYSFDFGDGTSVGPQSSTTAAHTYDTPGTYIVKVTATDADGLSATSSGTITVSPPPSPPTARIAVTPSGGTTPLQVTADAGATTDPQGQNLSYSFDFGDGTTVGPQTGSTASHTYSTAGTYAVKVTATDTAGLSDTATQTVAMSPPSPPNAGLTVSPASGTAPLQVSADASASSDPQGQNLSYSFDFGDGTTVGPQGSATAGHTYSAAGTYTVKVTVTDTSGLSDSTTRTVTVSPAPQPPTAKLTVTPTTGTAPIQVTANASASTDPQGQTLSYSFDFGDGTTLGPQTSPTATHTYNAAGSYTVKVTATDTSGLSSNATQTVTVSAPKAPTASLSVTPTSGTAPVQVTANASASTDPQGQTLSYSFDFGDGTTLGPQTSATATHTYGSAGSYTVKVTVTNTAGLSSSTTRSVSVAAAPSYVGQVVTASSAQASKTAVVTLSQGVTVGDLIVLGVQASTSSNKNVTATDDAADSYSLATSATDSSGAKLSVLYARASKALAAGAKITVTLPVSSTYRITADDLTGVTKLDRSAIATGRSSSFSSGATRTTTVAREVVLGVVGVTSGSTGPTWSTGWTSAGTLSTGSNLVGRASRVTTAAGAFTASGTIPSGTWTAAVLTFQP